MVPLVFALMACVFSLDYLANIAHVLPKPLTLLPEALAGLAAVLVAVYVQRQKLAIGPKYIAFFLLFGAHLLAGAISNGTDPGAIVAGLRVYLKYIPFFMLAVVYPFSDKQMASIGKVVLAILVFQLPVAFLQRFVLYPDLPTGDVVRGTLETSSFLSLSLISAIGVLTGFLVTQRLSTKRYLTLTLLLFLPTTINETKATLLLLPLALGIPFFVRWRAGGELPFGGGLKPLMLGAALLGAFVFVYDYMVTSRGMEQHQPVLAFFSDENALLRYLAPRTSGLVDREDGLGPVGRIDRLVLPMKVLSEEPTQVFFGLGVGNVTESPLSELSGGYLKYRQENAVGASASYLLWETGVFGVFLSFVFLLLIYRDAKYLTRGEGFPAAFALGWMGVTAIAALSMFYKDIVPINALMYPFWFYSGYVVRHAWLLRQKAAVARRSPFAQQAWQGTPVKVGPADQARRARGVV